MATSEKLQFDDILMIHEVVAHKIAINAGMFADSIRNVISKNGKYISILPKDIDIAKKEFNTLIYKLSKANEDLKIKMILKNFVKMIIEQWFNDANKRTALLVANKLLIDHITGLKVNLLIDFESGRFNGLLSKIYINQYVDSNLYKNALDMLVAFLKDSMISVDKNITLEQMVKMQIDSLSVCSEKIKSTDLPITKQKPYVVYNVNNIEMIAYSLEEFIESFDNNEDIKFNEKESDQKLLQKCKNILLKNKKIFKKS